jgi:cell division protein FtsX
MSGNPTTGPWRQAIAGIGHRPMAWLITALVAGIALGAVLLLAVSLRSLWPLAQAASIAPQATVMLAAGTGPGEADALRGSLSLLPTVAATRLISRDTALAQVAARTPADRDAIGQLPVNPLPDVVVLTFRQGATPEAIESAAGVIRKMAHVDGIELELGWYRKFRALARIGGAVSMVAMGLLMAHAVGWLLVAITLSSPIEARHARLLWLLGADDRAVRRAPVTGAALTAVVVAVIALAAARAGWVWLDREVGSAGQLYGSTVRLQWPAPSWVASFLAAAGLAGAVIGSIRARIRLRAIRAETG